MAKFNYYYNYFINLLRFGLIDFFVNRRRFKKFTSRVIDFKVSGNLLIKSEYLKQIDLRDILGDKTYENKPVFENWYFRQGNLTLYELFCICSMIKAFEPGRVFEIGTFDGLSTLHFALNSSGNCKIHTLDLPEEDMNNIRHELAGGDKELIVKKEFEIGSHYKNHSLSGKIIQHFSDSAKFDYSGYLKTFDLVFIDGAHSYEYVKADTENSLKILKDDGIILWHDYGSVIDVTEYLNGLSKTLNISRIKDTCLAYYSRKEI